MITIDDGSIYTGPVTHVDLNLADYIQYRTYVNASLRNGFKDIKFYASTFVDSGFSGLFTNVEFKFCKFVNVDLCLGRFVNCKFTKSSFAEMCYPSDMSGLGITPVVVAQGDLIVYKKCENGVIVTLRIPKEAKRSTTGSGKFRAEYAIVLRIQDSEGKDIKEARSWYDPNFRYEVGKLVKPSRAFDDNPWNECSTGIHFYLSLEEAKDA